MLFVKIPNVFQMALQMAADHITPIISAGSSFKTYTGWVFYFQVKLITPNELKDQMQFKSTDIRTKDCADGSPILAEAGVGLSLSRVLDVWVIEEVLRKSTLMSV